MALKLAIFLLASFFLVTAEVSSNEEEHDTGRASAAPSSAPYPKTPHAAPAPAPKIVYVDIAECPGLCVARCAKHSRPNHCHRVCGTCCERCRCVPPGTYGNREMCGTCYTDMTTHNNRTKCP